MEQQPVLKSILHQFRDRVVAVVGDMILDEFIWGKVERISPEAPVPVVEVTRESVRLGGAANVAANLAALGAVPRLVGIIGQDSAGRSLCRELCNQGISTDGLVVDGERTTSIKTRIIAHQQQVCRTDRESRGGLSEGQREKLRRKWSQAVAEAEAVILSDYSKGVLGPETASGILEQCRTLGKFVAVDPKVHHFATYRHASIITPNQKEAQQATGVSIVDEVSLIEAGRRLLQMSLAENILITRGEQGMTLVGRDDVLHIPTVAREVFDVTGAGDTVVAALTLAVSAGATISQAAWLANHAAGVVIGKLGTAVVTVDELRNSLQAGRSQRSQRG